MPVIEVEVVGTENPKVEDAAGRIADAAGEVFGSEPGETWVRLRFLPTEQYAESGGGPPEGIRPVFVRVVRAKDPGHEELASESMRLAEAVAGVFGRHRESIHVLHEPAAAGRMAFGGRLLPS